jgi:short-subunit dehydrogenase involved in D-alanine esterification of teichoic acids
LADSGTLVNIGTPGALIPLEAQPLYCATKAGLHMFTQTLRRQLVGTPVRVIEVFPPGLPTNLTRELEVAGSTADASVVTDVAARIYGDVVNGVEVSLPHEQSVALYNALPAMDPIFIDRVNSGVRRRPGWDRPQTS